MWRSSHPTISVRAGWSSAHRPPSRGGRRAHGGAPAPGQGEAPSLLRGPLGAAADRSADWGATLAYLDYGHPVFEMFRGPHSGDFSSARFFRYRRLEAKDGVL